MTDVASSTLPLAPALNLCVVFGRAAYLSESSSCRKAARRPADTLSLDYGGNSAYLTLESFSDMARDPVKFHVRLAHRDAP